METVRRFLPAMKRLRELARCLPKAREGVQVSPMKCERNVHPYTACHVQRSREMAAKQH